MRFLPVFLALFSSDAGAQCAPEQCVVAPPATVLHLDTEISVPEALPFVVELIDALKAKEPKIEIQIDSPGGSVGLGLAIIGALNAGRKAWGMEVTCVVDRGGMAASMAGLILETSCDRRIMYRDSALMFHEVSVSGAGGNMSDLRGLADQLEDLGHRLSILVANRLGMTAREYDAWIRGRTRWLSWDEALERHAIDEVR